jgi:hypothetical protein
MGSKIVYKRDGSLYLYDIKNKESEKVGSDAENFYYEGDTLVYVTSSSDLYKVNKSKEGEKIAFDVTWFHFTKDQRLYYITKDDYLYQRLQASSESKTERKISGLCS